MACADLDPGAATRPCPRRLARAWPARRAPRRHDAEAGAGTVDGVVGGTARLDLIFNNAGISVGGETEDLTLDHWNTIIDVNIRGVVHGSQRPTR